MLDFMVETQLGIGFNKLENAAVALDRGQHIYIPVEVNGTTKSYIFDTGCSFGNFVSEKYEEEVEDCGGFCRAVKLNKKQHRIVSFS